MSIRELILLAAMATALSPTVVAAASQKTPKALRTQPTCTLPTSDAEALVILSNYYPGYWWDHTNLTIAVQPHPRASEAQITAIREAIVTWSEVVYECFDGLITLTDVTGMQPSAQRAADIVVHFVPTAGGVVFDGYAICGAHGCPNILVRSDLPPSLDRDPYRPGIH